MSASIDLQTRPGIGSSRSCQSHLAPKASAGSVPSGPVSSPSASRSAAANSSSARPHSCSTGSRCSGSSWSRRLPDHLQHRSDALHPRHRRAGVLGLHAHASLVHAVGLGLRHAVFPAGRLAGVGGYRGRRDVLPGGPTTRPMQPMPRRSTLSASPPFSRLRRS